MLAVQLTPASARPYIGGSTDNTVLDLALGYNGINRLLGHHRKGTPLGDWGGSSLPMLGGRTGLHRLFIGEMGNEISWLIPVALFVVAFGLYLAVRRALSRDELCALVMWGTWLVVTGVVFSFMGGMVHPYYTVALAPAVAALVGIGAVWAWRRRSSWDGRCGLAAMIVLAAVTSVILAAPQRLWPGMAALADRRAGPGERRRRTVAPSTGGRAVGRVLGRACRYRSVFRRDRRNAASWDDAQCCPDVAGDRRMDRRRSHQCPTGRLAGRHAHDVVGGDERFTVSRRPRNRLRHIGDGRWRLER